MEVYFYNLNFSGLGQELGEVDLLVLDSFHAQVLPHPQGELLDRQVDDHQRGVPDARSELDRQADHAHDDVGGLAAGKQLGRFDTFI